MTYPAGGPRRDRRMDGLDRLAGVSWGVLVGFLFLASPSLAGDPTPTDFDNLEFYVTSLDFGPQSIAQCNTQACFDERFTELADIDQLYCDTAAGAIPGAVGYAPEGCVRWWEDQGPHNCGACGTGDQADEWIRGHRHGQDDRQKPALVNNCVNGQPCARIPRLGEMGSNADQIACVELEFDDVVQVSGDFSLLFLVAPRNQGDDWWYFGESNNGLRHSSVDETLFFRAGATPEVQISRTFAVEVVTQRWQLIEIYRDGAGRYQVFVNEEDVTAPGNPSNTAVYSHRYLGAQNCNGTSGGMVGDMALFALYSDLLNETERQQLRSYIDGIYSYNGLFTSSFEAGDTSDWSSATD